MATVPPGDPPGKTDAPVTEATSGDPSGWGAVQRMAAEDLDEERALFAEVRSWIAPAPMTALPRAWEGTAPLAAVRHATDQVVRFACGCPGGIPMDPKAIGASYDPRVPLHVTLGKTFYTAKGAQGFLFVCRGIVENVTQIFRTACEQVRNAPRPVVSDDTVIAHCLTWIHHVASVGGVVGDPRSLAVLDALQGIFRALQPEVSPSGKAPGFSDRFTHWRTTLEAVQVQRRATRDEEHSRMMQMHTFQETSRREYDPNAPPCPAPVPGLLPMTDADLAGVAVLIVAHAVGLGPEPHAPPSVVAALERGRDPDRLPETDWERIHSALRSLGHNPNRYTTGARKQRSRAHARRRSRTV